MKRKLLAALVAVCMLLSLSATAFAAPGPDDVAKIGETGYATLQDALDAVADGETIELLKDVEVESFLSINKAGVSFTITSEEGSAYTIKAVDPSGGEFVRGKMTSMVYITNGTVTLADVTIDADGKARVVGVNGADVKLIVDGATITGGSPNRNPDAASRYIGGVYVSGTAAFEMKSGSITGNDPGAAAEGNALQFASDLWIGANASGVITGGTVGNVFVNANEYTEIGPEGSFSVNGGEMENVFVAVFIDDASKVYAPTFTYNDGTVDTLYLATKYGVDLDTPAVIENPVAGEIYQAGPTQLVLSVKEITVTEGEISETVTATVENPSVIGGTDLYQWYQVGADGSEAVTGATDATFAIPTDLTAGTYQFYCVVDTGSNGVSYYTSDIVTVTVEAAETTTDDGGSTTDNGSTTTPGNNQQTGNNETTGSTPSATNPTTGDAGVAGAVLLLAAGAVLCTVAKRRARK